MILPDTSGWVEFFRRTGSPAHRAMRALLGRSELAITEPVVMEMLAGPASDHHLHDVRRRLLALPMLRVGGLESYERAAAIHRVCRARGETIRSMTDCLIAAVAMRDDVPILSVDRDFNVIARHTGLQIYSLT